MNSDVVNVEWLPYDKETNPVMELNVQSAMSFNSEHEICAWMDKMHPMWPCSLPNDQNKMTRPKSAAYVEDTP